MSESQSSGKIVVGKVVSNKMQKTIVVLVERSVQDLKYGKILKRHTKLYAHDEEGKSQIGDFVKIRETRPLSKMKNWELIEVIS